MAFPVRLLLPIRILSKTAAHTTLSSSSINLMVFRQETDGCFRRRSHGTYPGSRMLRRYTQRCPINRLKTIRLSANRAVACDLLWFKSPILKEWLFCWSDCLHVGEPATAHSKFSSPKVFSRFYGDIAKAYQPRTRHNVLRTLSPANWHNAMLAMRGVWETVRVQVPSSAPFPSESISPRKDFLGCDAEWCHSC